MIYMQNIPADQKAFYSQIYYNKPIRKPVQVEFIKNSRDFHSWQKWKNKNDKIFHRQAVEFCKKLSAGEVGYD